MKQFVRYLLGLNLACIMRGLRFGPAEFRAACLNSLGAVHPRQERTARDLIRQLDAIPTISLDDILGSRRAPVSLEIQRREDGMLPIHEAVPLLSILVAENPKEVLEIGTFMGHTAKAMAGNLPEGVIHTVDLPLDFSQSQEANGAIPKDDFHLIQRRVVGREFKGQPVEARIRQHLGDTATIDFREFGRPNFFFIDGSHTYEYCKQDSEKCFELCQGQGTFLWHDCDLPHPGVVQFVSEWRAAGRNLSIIEGTCLAYWKSPQPGQA